MTAIAVPAAALVMICSCTPATLPDDKLQLGRLQNCPSMDDASLKASLGSVDHTTSVEDLTCLLKNCRSNGNEVDVARLAAMISFMLAEVEQDAARRRKLAAEGVRWAERALLLGGHHLADVHYYLALNLGIAVRDDMDLALKNLKRLERAFKTARELDSDIDCSGPVRLLGMLYLRAPPWPKGIGDGDKAQEMLEEAVKRHPEHPLNHILLAKVLWELDEDDAREEITEHLRRAVELLANPRWKRTRTVWMRELERVARDAGVKVP